MSILWGLFETFLDFLSISVEPQQHDKIPQLGLITLYVYTRTTKPFFLSSTHLPLLHPSPPP